MSIENIYHLFYLLVSTILLFLVLNKAKEPMLFVKKSSSTSVLCVVLVIVLTLVVGFRPRSVGADTTQYMQMYEYLNGYIFEFDKEAENLLFDNFIAYMGSLNYDISTVFLVMAFIYFGGIYVACRKLFQENQEIIFFSTLVAFSTFSYCVNGIKAGAGGAIFLVALAYREKKMISIALALLAVGVHHSMIVVVYAYIISLLYRNTKVYFVGWLMATLFAIAHIGIFQELFAAYADEKGKEYLSGEGYMTGFRPDFILYSAMPILVGYYMLFKYKIKNEMYELWLRMYLTTNSVWMLCMYASYTNRIAYLSWFMYPLVLLMPYYAIRTIGNQLTKGRIVALCHLYFTLFMVFVYYGILH